jgi:sporulation protein YlmC with PRC-barrel domain
MRFKHDASVSTLEGETIGHIERVVINPETKEVTHLVVRNAAEADRETVVPIELVSEATELGVTVLDGAGDLDPLAPVELAAPAEALASLAASPQARDGEGDSAGHLEASIPEGAVTLKEGAKVIAADGKRVGVVEQVLAPPGLQRATHLVIVQGRLLKERRRIPVDWVSESSDVEIHLTVNSQAVDQLGFVPDAI